ncbi:MAG: four helix bundle protein [Candidatus Omnitrophica bacterium]|nr:four helix bundle protein [Candidatus Omnitrophota bacterium]
MARSFKELDVWKKGIDLVVAIYKVTETFPGHEAYGLTAQMRRCAISVPSNIAEGFKRNRNKEFKYFLDIAMGSLAELETQLIIAEKLELIDKSKCAYNYELIDHLMRMATNLSKSLTQDRILRSTMHEARSTRKVQPVFNV